MKLLCAIIATLAFSNACQSATYKEVLSTVESGKVVVLCVGCDAPKTINVPPGCEIPIKPDDLKLVMRSDEAKDSGIENGVYVCYKFGNSNRMVRVPVTTSAGTALDEVNAKRAERGLRPLIHDVELEMAALKCAASRAAARLFGHTNNDFAFLPAGATAHAAGCAAYPSHMGWLSCCTYESNWTHGGAAYVTGDDGKRYMHLFVRQEGGSSQFQSVTGTGTTTTATSSYSSSTTCTGPNCGAQKSGWYPGKLLGIR